ncbi:hypothetical protein [Actinoplanes sp. NPDC049118]|uniref:hypothetical protein n=1 Tax=Actinoplanes sp. NPDC049118 TaxID=3155769 RepID=UPI0034064309
MIVYQERPRRPWRLWVFTVALVALTVGVVLGQTAAFEPVYRPAAGAETVTAASAPPSAPGEPWPDAAHRVTAPLGSVRTRLLEVVGASAVLRVRSADLGETLFDIATTDRGAVPVLTDGERGSRLELVRTGDAGTAGAEIRLNAKVAWILRLTGGSTERNIDMRAGGLRSIEVNGGTAHVVLQLGAPKGTVPLSVIGPVGELVVRTEAGTPVRLRLGDGAGTAVVDGNTHLEVKAGAALASAGWSGARNRYDVATSGAVAAVFTATF